MYLNEISINIRVLSIYEVRESGLGYIVRNEERVCSLL